MGPTANGPSWWLDEQEIKKGYELKCMIQEILDISSMLFVYSQNHFLEDTDHYYTRVHCNFYSYDQTLMD